MNKCVKEKFHDAKEPKTNKESILFNYDDLPEEEEGDYDTEEDIIEEEIQTITTYFFA